MSIRYVCERQADGWTVLDGDGRCVPWQGMNTGPCVLRAREIAEFCRVLLGLEWTDAEALAEAALPPVTPAHAAAPALILHSTAPEKRTFEGELAAMTAGRSPYDSTTYAEARATLFARPGDLLVGRTAPWRDAVACEGLAGVSLPGADHYYLSHALLAFAAREPAALAPLVAFVRARPQVVVRLYALEPAMIVFLLWLRRATGVPALFVDANRPSVTRVWNRKSILYPDVELAATLPHSRDPRQMLATESAMSPLTRDLGVSVPILPGYTVSREGDAAAFARRMALAAELLRARYGLLRGCLKAAVSGGGMGIVPDIDLADDATLARLAAGAHAQGGEHVLEAHVNYDVTSVAGRLVALAPSAHIRGGRVAPGITLQLTRGTTWIGNIYLDEDTSPGLGVPAAICRRIQTAMHELRRGFEKVGGLVIGGVDFSVGTIGGVFGDEVLLAAQDPNLSFNGAECLRGFLERGGSAEGYGATLVIRPAAGVTLATLRAACRERHTGADAIAIVPERSGMLAVRAADPRAAAERLFALAAELKAAGLLLA